MNQIALDYQVGRARISCGLFVWLLRSNFILFNFVDPSFQEIDIALMSIETPIDVIEFNPIEGCHYTDMQNILLIQNMVKFPIFLTFHPHTTSALVQSHVSHGEEKDRIAVQRNFSKHLNKLLTYLHSLLIFALLFLDYKFFVVILQVFKSTYQSLFG